MVAPIPPRLVPVEFLQGAICLLPERPPALGRGKAMLSPAEREVLALVQSGCSNKEIAALLAKAEPTVKHQVSAILRKTGVQSRCQLLARFPASGCGGGAV